MKEGKSSNKVSEAPVWVVNPHGVASSVTPAVARELLKKPYWRVANVDEIEVVPEFKQYPEDLELTEKGELRRERLRAASEEKERRARIQAERATQKAPSIEEANQQAIEQNQKLVGEKQGIAAKMEAGENLTPLEYRELDWMSLRTYAFSHNLKVNGLKRDALLQELDKIHGVK